MFEMTIKKVNVSKIGDRISQTIILEKDKEEYLLVVNKKIDLSPFKKGDKVLRLIPSADIGDILLDLLRNG